MWTLVDLPLGVHISEVRISLPQRYHALLVIFKWGLFTPTKL